MPSATSKPPPPPPYALQLPNSAFATVSPSSYLAAHLLPPSPTSERAPRKPIRPNGRTSSQFRKPACATNTLAHTVGSAVTRLGDGTSVACGIQAEVLTLRDRTSSHTADQPHRSDHERERADSERLASLNLLVPNVELATGADPAYLTSVAGVAPTADAQTLSNRLLSLLLRTNLLTLDDLRITHPGVTKTRVEPRDQDEMEIDVPPTSTSADAASDVTSDEDDLTREPEAFWVLYITLVPLSISGRASLFDALWAAVVAALRTTRLPAAWWDADVQGVVCSAKMEERRALQVMGCPVASTWGVFVAEKGRVVTLEGGKGRQREEEGEGKDGEGVKRLSEGRLAWMLADPERGEDELCREFVTVVVDCEGEEERKGKMKVLAVEKKGGSVIGLKDMKGIFDAAERRWKEWRNVMPD